MGTDKVVTLHGNTAPDPRVPDPDTIAVIEDLLERAEAGEIQGVAAVVAYHDESAGQFAGGHVVTTRALGEIQLMSARIVRQMVGE